MAKFLRTQSVALAFALAGCVGAVDEMPEGPGRTPEAPGPGAMPRPPAPRPEGPAAPSTPAQDHVFREAFSCDPARTRFDGPRVWRLTAAQYNNTVMRLLGLGRPPIAPELASVFHGSGDSVLLNGASALGVQEAQAGPLRTLARGAAAAVVAEAKALEGLWNAKGNCPATPASYRNTACVTAFVEAFGLRAFRRPLEAAEAEGLVRLFTLASRHGASLDGGNDSAHLGVRAVVESVLQSPSFLYRVELPAGKGRAPLSPYQTASALSYFLTDNMPDAELFAAAERNELSTAAQVAAQARRLLESGGRSAVAELFSQWLNYEELGTRLKDETLFPQWEAVKGPMAEEVRRFVGAVVFDRKGKFADLFESNFTFVDKHLAPLYGAKADGFGADGWKELATKPTERAGLLTLSGLMAHTAVLERTSPVNRGLLVQERFFCTHVPDPPGDADLSIPDLAPNATRRQQLEAKTAPPLCTGCHSLMNGIGFGLETMDAIGRHRDKEENGLPIDPRGTIKGTYDSDGDFAGPRGLASALVASRQTKECFTLQTFRYALGRMESEGDACSLREAYGAFAQSGYDLKTLLVTVAASEAFRLRTAP
jgi:hypothetical protein